MEHRSEWLTSLRIRRMQKILLLLPGLAPGRTQNELIHVLWKKCGGTIALARPGMGYEIRVNWLTGGVEIVAQTQKLL